MDRWSPGISALLVLFGFPLFAQAGDEPSGYDKVWSYATLYENPDNRYLQKFALSGRLHGDLFWVDGDAGNVNDALWRRFRFGFKADVFENWVVHVEGSFDLNDSLGDMYSELTDAYIGWSPSENLTVKILKQSAGFTLDGATSSKKLLTPERNNLTNNLWFTREYFTGIVVDGESASGWQYKAGAFSSEGSEELSEFNAGYFILLSAGYDLAERLSTDQALVRVDYVYNEEDPNNGTRDFSQVASLVTEWQGGPWGLRTDLSSGKGYGDQSDVWGFVAMPYYDLSPRTQLVFRYTYLSSEESNGLRLSRYEDRVVDGRGDEYKEVFGGFNFFFYDHKLKWQTGLSRASMTDRADDGGQHSGWALSTVLRVYW